MNHPRSKPRGITERDEKLQRRHPRMFLIGVQFLIRLDSRLIHAGMTDFGLSVVKPQQAAGNEPEEIQAHVVFQQAVYFSTFLSHRYNSRIPPSNFFCAESIQSRQVQPQRSAMVASSSPWGVRKSTVKQAKRISIHRFAKIRL